MFIDMEHFSRCFMVLLRRSPLMYAFVPAVAALHVLKVVGVLELAVDSGCGILDSIIVAYCASSCLPTKCLVTPEGCHYSGGEVPVRPTVIVCEQAPQRVPPGQ